ncbi:MAG TPA: glycosyltransferase [Elusimicrobiales bacterium]|nr:glycosyltransferase [Elusimicrobiales bacterium]
MGGYSFSAVVITRHRPGLLRACLEGLVRALAGTGGELVVAINGPDGASLALAREMAQGRDFIRVLQLAGLCRGEARNAAMAAAGGEWFCFFDDDTVAAPDHFRNLKDLAAAFPEASAFGGGQEIDRASAGVVERAIFRVTGSPFGAGPFVARFRPAAGEAVRVAGESLILCNLAVRRDFLEKHGLSFEGHFTSAEENLLLNKMEALGAVMVLSPGLNLIHRRRTSLGGFFAQNFRSGMGRAQITFYHRAGFSAFTALPPAALLCAAGAFAIFPRLGGAACLAYLLPLLFFSVRAGAQERCFRVCAAAAAALAGLHLSYALGWFCGAAGVAADRLRGRVMPSRCVCREIP